MRWIHFCIHKPTPHTQHQPINSLISHSRPDNSTTAAVRPFYTYYYYSARRRSEHKSCLRAVHNVYNLPGCGYYCTVHGLRPCRRRATTTIRLINSARIASYKIIWTHIAGPASASSRPYRNRTYRT